jgi:hypothetical protein
LPVIGAAANEFRDEWDEPTDELVAEGSVHDPKLFLFGILANPEWPEEDEVLEV